MRMLQNGLLGVGALGFLVGALARVLGANWMYNPGTYWRGAIGCAAFAIALILMEMRDKGAMRM